MTEEAIKKLCYTKSEIDEMIAEAVEEARRIDEASMAKHNREATIISMILGFTALALFVDGLLRICLLYTSPSPRDRTRSRMPSSA